MLSNILIANIYSELEIEKCDYVIHPIHTSCPAIFNSTENHPTSLGEPTVNFLRTGDGSVLDVGEC